MRPVIDTLESRQVLSSTALADPVMTPSVSALDTTIHPDLGGSPPSSAVTPSQLASAYSYSLSASSGAGTTIAIVIAYNNPTIKSDLAAFSSYYGLPAANLTVVNQYGQNTNLPASDSGWSLESSLDVEWAHASAPGANIVLVEARSASISDLTTAVQTASSLGSVVSMSWGGSEWAGETQYDSASYFGKANVTFVAASGDDGGYSGAEWPSVSPNVVGVGGTTLSVRTGNETAWSASGWRWFASGSTGGASRYESVPSYQSTYGVASTRRLTPDVAADANPNTGVAVFSATGAGGWVQIGGTSAAAPVWAGIIAAADTARAPAGLPALGSAQTLSLLYGLGKSAGTTAFHDITSGSNFAGIATKGYDVVTGLGSPVASQIIAAASGSSRSAAVATATSNGGSSSGSGSTTTKTTSGTGQSFVPHDVTAATATADASSVNGSTLLVTAVPASTSSVVTSPITGTTATAIFTPTAIAPGPVAQAALAQAPLSSWTPDLPEQPSLVEVPVTEALPAMSDPDVLATPPGDDEPLAPPPSAESWSEGLELYLENMDVPPAPGPVEDLLPEGAAAEAAHGLVLGAVAASSAWAAWTVRSVHSESPEDRKRDRDRARPGLVVRLGRLFWAG
jgi:subtilase family serine protease